MMNEFEGVELAAAIQKEKEVSADEKYIKRLATTVKNLEYESKRGLLSAEEEKNFQAKYAELRELSGKEFWFQV